MVEYKYNTYSINDIIIGLIVNLYNFAVILSFQISENVNFFECLESNNLVNIAINTTMENKNMINLESYLSLFYVKVYFVFVNYVCSD